MLHESRSTSHFNFDALVSLSHEINQKVPLPNKIQSAKADNLRDGASGA